MNARPEPQARKDRRAANVLCLSVGLGELARVIRETAPGECMQAEARGLPPSKTWAGGCASACERIANATADSLDLRPSERAAFCEACGVANLNT